MKTEEARVNSGWCLPNWCLFGFSISLEFAVTNYWEVFSSETQSTFVYKCYKEFRCPIFNFFLFVCSLFFALNRKASSSLVFILTVYFSFYDLQLFILVQSLISSNWLAPATSISKLWAFVAGQKIYFIYRISYLILTLGALVNIWTKLEWRTKEAKRLAVYSEKGRVEKKKKEAEKRNMGIGTPSDS